MNYNKELAHFLAEHLLSYMDVTTPNGINVRQEALEQFLEEFLNERSEK